MVLRVSKNLFAVIALAALFACQAAEDGPTVEEVSLAEREKRIITKEELDAVIESQTRSLERYYLLHGVHPAILAGGSTSSEIVFACGENAGILSVEDGGGIFSLKTTTGKLVDSFDFTETLKKKAAYTLGIVPYAYYCSREQSRIEHVVLVFFGTFLFNDVENTPHLERPSVEVRRLAIVANSQKIIDADINDINRYEALRVLESLEFQN